MEPVGFETLQRGFLAKLFIDILDSPGLGLLPSSPTLTPLLPSPPLPASHPPTALFRISRAPVCSRQLWVGGSWLSVEHSRGEVTPLIP